MLYILIGTFIVTVVLLNIFQAVVQPRWKSVRQRFFLVLDRLTWPVWKRCANRHSSIEQKEEVLSSFAPASIAIVLALRLCFLIFGYALILFGLRKGINPHPHTLMDTIYLASVSFTTLGFGDFVPTSTAAKVVVIVTALSGVALMAMVISFIFALHSYVHQREVPINLMVARTTGNASGLSFLLNHTRRGMIDHLPASFSYWETWLAQMVESQSAYPLLAYFRSSIPTVSWVGTLGSVLDAASLLISSVEDVPLGAVQLFYDVGCKATPRMSKLFDLDTAESFEIEKPVFEEALKELAAAGYKVRAIDEAWQKFREARAGYIMHIRALARYFAVPPTPWITD